MKRSLSHSEQVSMHPALTLQRRSLAVCILLAPLSISLYLVSWEGNLRQPLIDSAMAGSTGNTLHFLGAIAASFFLPLGYLGMSLLGMRRAPWLATISAALSLVGWIPWAALMGLDALAYDIGQTGSTPQLAALWMTFNGDTVMTAYLLIYIIGHLLSAVLIGFMLGRLRLIPAWAAWAFALTSPLTIPLIQISGLRPLDHRCHPHRPCHAHQQRPGTTGTITCSIQQRMREETLERNEYCCSIHQAGSTGTCRFPQGELEQSVKTEEKRIE
jgi:hypothetical protein